MSFLDIIRQCHTLNEPAKLLGCGKLLYNIPLHGNISRLAGHGSLCYAHGVRERTDTARQCPGRPRARITVKVQPRARATRVAGRMEGAYRLQVAAPPVDGKANEACIAFFAEVAGVARARVRIVSGLTGRMKIVEIEGIGQAEMERRLGE